MYPGITRAEQNLTLLQSMIPGNEQFYIWCYRPSGELVATSCPPVLREPLDQAFHALGAHKKALELAEASQVPRIIGSGAGMQWAVTTEEREQNRLLFVCGPVFYSVQDERSLRSALESSVTGFGHMNWILQLLHLLPELPVMTYAVFSRYVMMVHNTLTGQQLGLEALTAHFQQDTVRESPAGERNRLGVYQAEQMLLDMVRKGDINYHGALRNSSSLSAGVPVHGKNPLEQMRISCIVFTTLVSRAAMEGGLSPETAYSLGDSYIQSAVDSRDSGEIAALTTAMYHDFIYRVHHVRSNPGYSHAVQKCCDYIELSLDRRISAADLAALVGYTEYYLTEKFKKETGKSVSNYIRDAKVSRARVLLESTSLSIAEIAERLAFTTPSYFIQSFRAVCGCTPVQYRKSASKAPGGNPAS